MSKTIKTSEYAIRITNDPGFENEVWGPYSSVDECREVIAAFVGVPESAEIVAADVGRQLIHSQNQNQ